MAEMEKNLCPRCMNPLDPQTGVCAHCAASPVTVKEFEDALPEQSVLIGRYQVGSAYDRSGESIRYIGYDLLTKRRVWVKEYMPSTIAYRMEDKLTLNPREGRQAQYKALMYDFIDLNKALRSLPNQNGLIPVLDTLHANNTAYAIFPAETAMTFEEFLRKCGGVISWEQARPLFMPLLATVANVHKAGIVHRGISPKTVWIDEHGVLQLTDFAIPALRTEQSELSPEIFSGYAAPEQYNPSDWQGTWTDIYGLGALLYQTLTGLRLPESTGRALGDTVVEACQCNALVPQNISKVISQALAIKTTARIQTADELSCRLLDDGNSNTAVYNREAVAEQENPTLDDTLLFEDARLKAARSPEQPPAAEPKPAAAPAQEKDAASKKNSKYILMAGVFSLVLLLAGIAIFLIFYSGGVGEHSSSAESSSVVSEVVEEKVPSFIGKKLTEVKNDPAYQQKFTFTVKEEENDSYPEGVIFGQDPKEDSGLTGEKTMVTLFVSKGTDQSSSEEEVLLEMPNFIGREAADVEKNASYANHFLFSLKYDYNEDYAEGQVYAQSPKENSPISEKITVTLYVSKGSRYVTLPTNLMGLTIQEAQKQLSAMGIKSAIAYQEDDTVPPGTVVGTDRANGESIDKTTQTVLLYVSKKSTNSSSAPEPAPEPPEASSSAPTVG